MVLVPYAESPVSFPTMVKSEPPACIVSSSEDTIPSVIAQSATMVAIPIPIPMMARIAELLFINGFFKISEIKDINYTLLTSLFKIFQLRK